MAIPEHVLSASRLNRAKLKPKTSKCLFQNDPFVYFFDLTMNRLLPGVTIIGRVQVLQKNECQGRNQNLVGFQILPGEIKIGINFSREKSTAVSAGRILNRVVPVTVSISTVKMPVRTMTDMDSNFCRYDLYKRREKRDTWRFRHFHETLLPAWESRVSRMASRQNGVRDQASHLGKQQSARSQRLLTLERGFTVKQGATTIREDSALTIIMVSTSRLTMEVEAAITD